MNIAVPFLSVREMSRRAKQERDNPLMRAGIRLITSVVFILKENSSRVERDSHSPKWWRYIAQC